MTNIAFASDNRADNRYANSVVPVAAMSYGWLIHVDFNSPADESKNPEHTKSRNNELLWKYRNISLEYSIKIIGLYYIAL